MLTVTAWSDVRARSPTALPPRLAYNMPSLLASVHPLRHPLQGRMPLLLWNLPLPAGQPLVWSRRSGALRKTIDQLAERGIVPVVQGYGDGALALAKTIQEAGQPVYLLIPTVDIIERHAWTDCPTWVDSGETRLHAHRKYPCLPMYDSKAGAEFVRQQVVPFQHEGIAVAGVFFDDEGLPNYSDELFASQAHSPACVAQYPAGVIDNPAAFKSYVASLRATLTAQILAEPVHRLFPKAIVGDFADAAVPAPPGSDAADLLPGGDAAMPALYANPADLRLRWPGHPQAATQAEADQFYVLNLLRSFSAGAPAARGAHKMLVPYVGQWAVYADPQWHDTPRIAMGRAAWREMLFHVWLRGADGMYLFNLGAPSTGVSPDFSFGSVSDAVEVYDELLEYHEFLEHGQPMNFTVPADLDHDAIWSGLRLEDRCIVRVFPLGRERRSVELSPFEGVVSKLDAPPAGATYLLERSGKSTLLPVK